MGTWRPHEGVVQLRDGRRLRGAGIDHGRAAVDPPELAIYLLDTDPGPRQWDYRWVHWPDFEIPEITEDALAALRQAFTRSVDTRVEIACNGGVGRTGTAMALLAVMAGTAADDAVVWVRRHYHPNAVEPRSRAAGSPTPLLSSHSAADHQSARDQSRPTVRPGSDPARPAAIQDEGSSMRIGVPKEVKNHEYRVAITPNGVHELLAHGHEVVIQREAGVGSQISDEEFVGAGARIVTAEVAWGTDGRVDMVVKVKEPIAEEYHRLREGLTLFTYLHLAADKPLTQELVDRKTTAIAYETVQLPSGGLPLLYPMSEVAGCLAPQVGAHSLMKAQGGRGVLMGGVGGVANAKVVIIGAGCPDRTPRTSRSGWVPT